MIILADITKSESIDRVAANILYRLSETFTLENETVYLSASMGVTLYPQDAVDIEDLLKQADQAMYLAKSLGRNRLSYFTPELQKAAQDRLHMLNDLRGALAANQFQLHFQPIVHLSTGKISKVEALIRWLHPEHGLISPAQLIPLAEETGLIVEIDDWVFREATRQLKEWEVTYGTDIQIGINKSPMQLKHPESMPLASLPHQPGPVPGHNRDHRRPLAGSGAAGQHQAVGIPERRDSDLHRRLRHQLLFAVLSQEFRL